MTLPIAYREMLLLARSPATYRARITTGVATVVAGSAFALLYARYSVSALPFLGIIGYFLSLLCMFTGAQLTADSIAREKREGTLGFLFLTGLRPWQISLGKLVSHAAAAFFRIFVVFPLLAMVLIMGGVLPSQVFLMVLVLLNTLFVTACIGLCASSWETEQRRAAGLATGLVMLFWLGLPFLAQVTAYFRAPYWVGQILLSCSLGSSLLPNIMGPRFGVSASPWVSLLTVHALGWMFFALATWTIPFQWQDRPDRKKWSLKQWWKRVSYGSAAARERARQLWLDRNPFLWLAARDRFRFLNVWIFILAMIGIGLWAFRVVREPGPLVALCVAASVVHRFLAAAGGGAQLMIEQEQGTLEMLISTPLSPQEILQGQLRASARQNTAPALLLIIFQVLSAVLVIIISSGGMNVAVVMVLLSASVGLYILDLYTGLWLSMWAAVISTNSRQAAGAAMVRLMGLPFFTVAAVTLLIGLCNAFLGTRFYLSVPFSLTAICLLIIGNDVFWLRRIRRELPGKLRSYALRRYSPEEPSGLLAALGRTLGRWYGGRRGSSSRGQEIVTRH